MHVQCMLQGMLTIWECQFLYPHIHPKTIFIVVIISFSDDGSGHTHVET